MKTLLIAFAFYSLTATAQQLNTDSIFELADSALINRKYDTAIHLYSIIIQADSTNRLAFRQRGRAKVYQHPAKHDNGISDLTRAILLFPQDTFSYFNRGFAYQILGKFKAAIKDYTAAIDLAPIDNLYNSRASVYIGLHKYGKALKDFDKAILLNPTSYILSNRARLHIKLENFSKALKDFDSLIELYPKDAYYYKERAWCKANLFDMKGACADIQKARELGAKMSGDEVNRYCK